MKLALTRHLVYLAPYVPQGHTQLLQGLPAAALVRPPCIPAQGHMNALNVPTDSYSYRRVCRQTSPLMSALLLPITLLIPALLIPPSYLLLLLPIALVITLS